MFYLAADRVRQRRLGDLAWKVRAFGGPVADRGAEACAIRSSRFIWRSSIRNEMSLNGCPRLIPGKTNASDHPVWPSRSISGFMSARIVIVRGLGGTR
ncbi:hypothetical protein [Rhodovulum sp. PH10]|uniref:hypothetical protein n=1 Tax=Rhodovulum sp. PH10 TaxID=1187851 RepID=UPI00178C559D|nr:hypothetical protein [Rhodovulum sp. PH10]